MGETHYAAVTGDLVASRKVPAPSRAQIQRGTLEALEELNGALGAVLARPAVLTAGDEIQALLRVPSRVVGFVQVLEDRLFGAAGAEQDIAFGVGWGELSTGLLSPAEGVEQLDGACFHRAREALVRAKKRKLWAVFQGFGELEDRTLTSLFELMGAIRAGWTAKQHTHTLDLRQLGKRIAVARRRAVSPSVITESLQLSRFDAIQNGEETARRLLARFDPSEA